MGEFKCHTDREKNRLYIKVRGFFREKDTEFVYRELEDALKNLRTDFDVVTDLSGFVPVSPEAVSALRKGAELVKDSGRRNAVRITGGLVSGMMQFKRVLRPVFDEESVRYAKSTEEADAILDSMILADRENGA